MSINLSESKKFVVRFCLIPLETSGGILFSLEGFGNNPDLQFKTLPGVIYIPLEGYRYPFRRFIIPLEGFRYPYRGFIIPLEGFNYPSWGFIIPLEGFRYSSRRFKIPLEGFRYTFRRFKIPLEGFRYPFRRFIIPLEGFFVFNLCDRNNLKNWRGSTQTEIYFQ